MVHLINTATQDAITRKPIQLIIDAHGERALWDLQVDEINREIVAIPFSSRDREVIDSLRPHVLAWSAHAVLSGKYHSQAIIDAILLIVLNYSSSTTNKVANTHEYLSSLNHEDELMEIYDVFIGEAESVRSLGVEAIDYNIAFWQTNRPTR